MPFINKQNEDKYRFVDEILKASDYYHVLGIDKNAVPEEIRRAYIKKSRICHPDKFVPSYPQATQSFQILSIAYETLINPSTKLVYDLSTQKGTHTFDSSPFESFDETSSNDTLQRVLQQLFNEMLEGEFQTLRAFIYALNDTSTGMHITEDALHQIELGFQKMSELVQSTRQYYKVIQFELLRLYELQHELRQLSYFSVWKRMQLTITLCKILLQLPIIINTHTKQKQLLEHVNTNFKDHGLLNQHIESALKMAVGLLETGEKYTRSW